MNVWKIFRAYCLETLFVWIRELIRQFEVLMLDDFRGIVLFKTAEASAFIISTEILSSRVKYF